MLGTKRPNMMAWWMGDCLVASLLVLGCGWESAPLLAFSGWTGLSLRSSLSWLLYLPSLIPIKALILSRWWFARRWIHSLIWSRSYKRMILRKAIDIWVFWRPWHLSSCQSKDLSQVRSRLALGAEQGFLLGHPLIWWSWAWQAKQSFDSSSISPLTKVSYQL